MPINTDNIIFTDMTTQAIEPKEKEPWENFTLKAYNSKPIIELIGNEPWGEFLGVELEVELIASGTGDNKQRAQQKAAFLCSQVLNEDPKKPFVLLKNDGSLTNGGFEMCTSPAAISEHRIKWDKFFDNLPANIQVLDTCGMHVHISREPLSYMQIGKMIAFIHNPANADFITAIAGRGSCHYSNFSSNKTEKMAMPQYGGNFDHYSAINLVNSATIEIRIFKSTLKKEEFFKNLEFCHALSKYCFPGLHSLKSSKDYKNFLAFVIKHYKDYPSLTAFLVLNKYVEIKAKSKKN